MPIDYPISDLPTDLSLDDAVEGIYGEDLDWLGDKLRRGVSCLVECDKQLVTWFYGALRRRLRDASSGQRPVRCRFVSGQAEGEEQQQQASLIQLMVRQIAREVHRHVEDPEHPRTVIVVPHLDLLTTTTRSGLSMEAREVIALVYENPEVLLLGFKDPEFELPKTIEGVFTAKRAIIGIPRERLPRIILQREARKFGVDTFDPFSLYKYTSGLNAVRVRQILEQFAHRMDFDPRTPETRVNLFAEIRELTRGAELEVPKIDLKQDIGGYEKVKERIDKDILSLLLRRDSLTGEKAVKAVEELIPRGIIFEGPPGTGKTFFAKAIATAIDATAIVISGPELKSKWVGESEANLRNIFTRARRSAPAIIIFDEIDSFAHRRGSYSGSGVEHSMVNQLLTEMDGFRKEELVFVIATTNFVESLDEALLRPGRFELKVRVPYPKEKDRRAIFDIYNQRFGLELSQELLDFLVRKTGGYVSSERRARFSGDHINAICRGLARERIRKEDGGALTEKDCEEVMGDTFNIEAPTKAEEKVICTHECGHTLVATLTPGADRPEKVTIEGDEEEPTQFYTLMEQTNSVVKTREDLLASIDVSMGGQVAEVLCFGQPSSGASMDLLQATRVARAMVEVWGMGTSSQSCLEVVNDGMRRRELSDSKEQSLDQEVDQILSEARQRVQRLLEDNRETLEKLAETLQKERVLHRKELKAFFTERGYTIDWRDHLKIKVKDKVKSAGDESPAEAPEGGSDSEPDGGADDSAVGDADSDADGAKSAEGDKVAS
jgi:cell division protease FtsH